MGDDIRGWGMTTAFEPFYTVGSEPAHETAIGLAPDNDLGDSDSEISDDVPSSDSSGSETDSQNTQDRPSRAEPLAPNPSKSTSDVTCDSASDDERNDMVLSWIATLPESPVATRSRLDDTAQGDMPSETQREESLEEEISTGGVARVTKDLRDINLDPVDPAVHGIVPQQAQGMPPSPLLLTQQGALSRPAGTRSGKKRRREDTSSVSVVPSFKTRRREVPLPTVYRHSYDSQAWSSYPSIAFERPAAGRGPVRSPHMPDLFVWDGRPAVGWGVGGDVP